MNFTFLPSSSFLIHSSSGMPEAPLASFSQRAYPIGFWGSCLSVKEAPYSDYLTTPRNENCGEDVKTGLAVTSHEASCQRHGLVSRPKVGLRGCRHSGARASETPRALRAAVPG